MRIKNIHRDRPNQQYFQIFRQSDKHFTFGSKNSLKTKAHKKAKKCKNSI